MNTGNEDDVFVVLATFTQLTEAQVVMTRLQSEGIECFIPNETTIRIMPHLPESQRVNVVVKRSDCDVAKEILQAVQTND